MDLKNNLDYLLDSIKTNSLNVPDNLQYYYFEFNRVLSSISYLNEDDYKYVLSLFTKKVKVVLKDRIVFITHSITF